MKKTSFYHSDELPYAINSTLDFSESDCCLEFRLSLYFSAQTGERGTESRNKERGTGVEKGVENHTNRKTGVFFLLVKYKGNFAPPLRLPPSTLNFETYDMRRGSREGGPGPGSGTGCDLVK